MSDLLKVEISSNAGRFARGLAFHNLEKETSQFEARSGDGGREEGLYVCWGTLTAVLDQSRRSICPDLEFQKDDTTHTQI